MEDGTTVHARPKMLPHNGFSFGPGTVVADDAFPFVESILPFCVIFTWMKRYRGLSSKNIMALTAHGGCRKIV